LAAQAANSKNGVVGITGSTAPIAARAILTNANIRQTIRPTGRITICVEPIMPPTAKSNHKMYLVYIILVCLHEIAYSGSMMGFS
jgi:hypothetical protein